MTQKDFSKNIVQSSQAHWAMVLSGKRNLGYRKAQVVASVLNTSIDLWLNPKSKSNERRAAWNLYTMGVKK
jgi:hypothetical protein